MPPRKTSQGQPASPANPPPPEFRKIPINEILPDPKNPRRDLHAGDPEYHNIQNSIDEFGFVDPIIIDTATREVIGGHQRLTVLRDAGITELYEIPLGGITWLTPDIDIKQLTKPQRTALNIALNKITGDWDTGRLVEALESIKIGGLDIAITGFGEKELVTFMADLQKGKEPQDAEPQISRAEELRKEWGTEVGQLWQCGSHRIVCGDCTNPAVVARLLRSGTPAAEVPGLMVTDPPYGVEYDPEWRLRSGLNKEHQTRAEGIVYNDDRSDWKPAWDLFEGAVAYVWHAGVGSPTVAASLINSGFELRNLIVWVKPSLVISRGHYHHQHEPCWYGVRKGKTAEWIGDRKQSTVWDFPNMHRTQGCVDDGKTCHSTQKPIGCMTRPIQNHNFDIVYDPFLGSGTTMIACENLGRKCRGIEVDPGYVAVILQRYKDTFPDKEIRLVKE